MMWLTVAAVPLLYFLRAPRAGGAPLPAALEH
jgi:hypothetical protein